MDLLFLIVRSIHKEKTISNKSIWKRCFAIMYAALFVFMFTYWGDHGLGDDSYVPIPHHRCINQSDETAFIEDNHRKQVDIGKFSYNDNFLYAGIADKLQIDGDYIVWNLRTDEWRPYFANNYLNLSKRIRHPPLWNSTTSYITIIIIGAAGVFGFYLKVLLIFHQRAHREKTQKAHRFLFILRAPPRG